MDQLYKELILEHWQNPQNFGILKNADIDTELDNPLCGDKIRLTIELKNNIVKQVMFTGEGCAISIASASIFTEEIKNKTLNEIKNIKADDVLSALQIQITPTRSKCALLILSVLKKGLSDFQNS